MQVKCNGCGKKFTPRGLSQHVIRTRDSRCNPVYATLPSGPKFIPHAASPPDPYPSHGPCVPGDVLGDGLGAEDALNAAGSDQSLDGTFTATRVAYGVGASESHMY